MMTEFKIGDIVYLKDELVEKYKRAYYLSDRAVLAPGQDHFTQFGLAKDIPLTIIDRYNLIGFYLTNFTDNWGSWQTDPVPWKGKYKAWILYGDEIEKRELNTISLYELNRGL